MTLLETLIEAREDISLLLSIATAGDSKEEHQKYQALYKPTLDALDAHIAAHSGPKEGGAPCAE